MSEFQALFLGILQGITEFLPISSSGHLIVVPRLFAWEPGGLTFDIAVHVGSLCAVIFFFRKRLFFLLQNCLTQGIGGKKARGLLIRIFVGILPAALVGFFFKNFFEEWVRTPFVVVASLIVWGVVLWIVDIWAHRQEQESSEHLVNQAENDFSTISFFKILCIGVAQVIALVPGTSRSGITLIAGLASKLSKKQAVEFSFLMSIPLILGAAVLRFYDVFQAGGSQIEFGPLVFGVLGAFFSGFLALKLLWKMAESYRFWPFALYRIVLGLGLLMFFL